MKNRSTLLYFISTFEKPGSETNFDEYKDILNVSGQAEYEPSSHIINNIMGFSNSYEVLKSKSYGNVEMIIN
ncbi:MAG: hypothetical protein HY958_04460 [Bacteroidia bacterium]|nr:hypothetical protein [Bacteroidia bacterium]